MEINGIIMIKIGDLIMWNYDPNTLGIVLEISKDIACITLKETGDMCNLRINSISRLNGKTSFGSYQISLKDIKLIELFKAQ